MSNSEEETQAKSDKPDNNLNQADELQTLFNTSSRVVRQHDLKTALVEVLNGLQKLVPHDSGSVYYHRPGDEWLEPILARGQKDEVFSQVKFPYKGSLVGRALQNHQFMMHNAVATDPEAFSPTDAPPNEFSGLLVAPLLISEQDEGWTLAIRRMTAPPFTEREFKLFQIFASYAEIAIENVRLYEVALRETEALRRVYTIMSTVGSLKSSDQIYSRVADEIRLIFDYDYLLISEIEVENNLFRVIFDSGIEEWQYEQKQGSLRGSSIEQAVKTSQYLVRNDLTVPLDPIYTYEEHLLQHNIRSYAIFPMRYEGRVSRVMIVSNRQPNAFDPASVNFLEILAGQLAITAENVHLFDRLRRTRRQWQIILDSIPDAVLLLNAADLTVLQTNRAAAALAACRPDELVGRSYRDIFYQVDPCLCYFPLEELHSPGTEFTEEANGTFSGRIYQRSIYPIFDNAGTLNEVVTHIREVTETKMIEQQLAQTVRLKAIGEMAAGIAHDFNNSLASILGNIELMLLENSDPHLHIQLVQLKQAALDGADTVRRVQSFGRKDGRKAYLKFELNAVIREVIELTRPRWQNQSQQQGIYVGMVLQLNKQLTIFGNPAEIKEAITNLIFNALDAMPKGGTLTLTTHQEQVNDRFFAVLQIADNGQGVPDLHRSKIFDPFFTTKGLKGTGLGLSMTRQIMAEHEGEIGFESILGEGTTFYLRFPMVQPDKTRLTYPGEIVPSKIESQNSGSHSRILVIDDDRTLCQVLQRILEHYGHQVDIAEGGKRGLEIFRTGLGDFDLVFTDLSMPEMSGYEIARVMKSLDPQVIIILMTGWGADLSTEVLATRGIDLHIAKPYRITDVLKLLEKAYELRQLGKFTRFTSSQDLA